MRCTRAEALRALLVSLPASPLVVPRPAVASFLQADDKSWDVSLPETWRVETTTMRSEEAGRLFCMKAVGGTARVEVTVDFSAAGQKSLKDLGTIDAVGESFLERQPQPAMLLESTKLPRPDIFSTGLYQFRYSTGGGSGESVLKLALQQGRLYQLLATLPTGAPEALKREVDDVVASFKAYPLNIGCLSASNRGGSLLPGVCY